MIALCARILFDSEAILAPKTAPKIVRKRHRCADKFGETMSRVIWLSPGGQVCQTGASEESSGIRAEGTGRGRGRVPLKEGVGVLHDNMCTLHALRPEASARRRLVI